MYQTRQKERLWRGLDALATDGRIERHIDGFPERRVHECERKLILDGRARDQPLTNTLVHG